MYVSIYVYVYACTYILMDCNMKCDHYIRNL